MNPSLAAVSILNLVPAIVLAFLARALAPAWLFAPAVSFAVFLAVVFVLVRVLHVAVGLALRAVVWMISTGMIAIAAFAIAVEPLHAFLAWTLLITALLALAATPPPRERRLA